MGKLSPCTSIQVASVDGEVGSDGGNKVGGRYRRQDSELRPADSIDTGPSLQIQILICFLGNICAPAKLN